MSNSVRWMMIPVVLAAAVMSGCRPCRCLDGTGFARELPCEECFTACRKIDSAPMQCRSSEMLTEDVLLPVPDPKFAAGE